MAPQKASREGGGVAVDDDEQCPARQARRERGDHVRGAWARLKQVVQHDEVDVVADCPNDRRNVGLVHKTQRFVVREPNRVDVRRRRDAQVVRDTQVVWHSTGEDHARGRRAAVGTMHIGCVVQHVVQSPADVLTILERCDTGRVNVEVVAELARRWVDENRVTAPALHKASAALVEEVTLGIGAAHRAADEAGVGARASDRLGGIELEPATDLISGLSGHHQPATDERDAVKDECDSTPAASTAGRIARLGRQAQWHRSPRMINRPSRGRDRRERYGAACRRRSRGRCGEWAARAMGPTPRSAACR